MYGSLYFNAIEKNPEDVENKAENWYGSQRITRQLAK